MSIVLAAAFGLQGSGTSTRCRPNQAIRDSIVTALATGAFFALLGPLCFGISYGWHYWTISGDSTGLQQGVVNAILGLCLTVATLAFGVIPVMKHWGLRFTLILAKRVPWAVVTLLDEAARSFLLKKAGGGYRFMHGYLREHFRLAAAVSASRR